MMKVIVTAALLIATAPRAEPLPGGQVERKTEIRDFVGRDLAASRRRLEECSDLKSANVASLLQRLSSTMQEIDQFIAELQALRQRLQHEASSSSARSCNTRT
jgi:hypothetical protein